jgi:hypothetical protein
MNVLLITMTGSYDSAVIGTDNHIHTSHTSNLLGHAQSCIHALNCTGSHQEPDAAHGIMFFCSESQNHWDAPIIYAPLLHALRCVA